MSLAVFGRYGTGYWYDGLSLLSLLRLKPFKDAQDLSKRHSASTREIQRPGVRGLVCGETDLAGLLVGSQGPLELLRRAQVKDISGTEHPTHTAKHRPWCS